MNKHVEILQHNIDYWYKEDQDMPEHEREHVQEEIERGYSQGQLVDENADTGDINTGWWTINND